jgi:RNA polymerase sigma factor (sigma-70 family)
VLSRVEGSAAYERLSKGEVVLKERHAEILTDAVFLVQIRSNHEPQTTNREQRTTYNKLRMTTNRLLANFGGVGQNRYNVTNALQELGTRLLDATTLGKEDAELVARCRRNDQTAWDELVDRYQKLVYTISRRAGLAEDQASEVFQDVFLTLVEKIDEINQPEKIRSWIVTTTKFKTWAIIRGAREHRGRETAEEFDFKMASIEDNSPLADDFLIELEEQHLIRTGLRSLNERCRQILSMLYLQSSAASYAEVGAAIGVGETSIGPLRSRCLNKLKKILIR